MKYFKIKSIFKQALIFSGLLSFVFIVCCKKDKQTPNTVEYSTVTDIDGNIYKTVKIGDQWWMAENLKVKRYNNGDSINYVGEVGGFGILDSSKWNNTITGAYCIIDNSSSTSQNYNGKMFGFLYNYYSVGDPRKIAPVGWHIPSDEDWKQMEIYLGMSSSDADKINWRGNTQGNKLRINTGWFMLQPPASYSVWGTNESGFTAIGGGCCMYNGVWGNPGTFSTGFWWTSTINITNNQPWYRYLDYQKANIFRFYGSMTYGFSIRCVKD